MLQFFVDALALPPPPGLVNEWAVGRIHQADDAVVHTDRHVGGEIGGFVFADEFRHFRSGKRRLVGFGKACTNGALIGKKDPNKTVSLFAGITAGIDAVNLQLLIRGERGNQLALAGTGLKAPAMVAALDLLAVKAAARERHAAMGAGVAQSE